MSRQSALGEGVCELARFYHFLARGKCSWRTKHFDSHAPDFLKEIISFSFTIKRETELEQARTTTEGSRIGNALAWIFGAIFLLLFLLIVTLALKNSGLWPFSV